MTTFDAFSSGLQLELGTSNMQLLFKRRVHGFGRRTKDGSLQRTVGFCS